MHSLTVRHIFWVPTGYSLPANYQALIDQFMADVATDSGKTSNVYSSDTQYTDTTSGHILYSVAFGGSILITDPFPSNATFSRSDCPLSVKSTCLTDTQLEQKIEAVAASQAWPLNTFTNAYAIFTPPGVDVCVDWQGVAFDRPCTYNAFCAYHNWGDLAAPPLSPRTIYAVEPAFSGGEGCNEPTVAAVSGDFTTDITINTLAHESNEFITDPTPANPPFGGWYDASGNENADKCAYNFGPRIGVTGSGAAYNQVINGHPYMLQRSWSNAPVPGTSAPGCYSIGAPTVTGIQPQSAMTGAAIAISGTNFFFPLGASPVVKFNGVDSPSVTVDSPTHITAEVPAGNVGGKISVLGTVGGNAASPSAFGLRPEVTSLSATSGFAGQTITVNGTGFFGVTSVKFNGVAGTFNTIAADGTSLHVVVPAAATTGAVAVTTGGGTGTSSTNFVALPHVTAFSPAAAVGGANVTISGTGFSGVPTVDFAGSPGAVLVSHTATSLVVHVPVDAVNGALTVTTADGSSVSAASFKPLPKVSGFDAATYQAGDTVTVSGSNFTATGVDPTAKLGVLAVVPGSVTATSFQFVVPDGGLTGVVSVTNSNGSANGPVTLKVRPTITGDPAPNDGVAAAHIVVSGKSFVGTSSVKFGDNTEAAAFVVGVGGTSLNVTVPSNATTGKIGVTNAGGTTLTGNIFVVHPHVTTFAPAAAVAGANVTISGTGFSGVPTVDFSGSAGAAVVSHTATSLVVHVPVDAVNGPLTVTTADGSSVSAAAFKPLPKITGFDAATYQANDTVTVSGSNFTAVGGLAAKLGALVLSPGSVTATSFQVAVPDGGLTGVVSVTNLNGSANSPVTLKVRPTVDESFAPAHGTTGTVITLTGKTFPGTTSVKVGGVPAAFALVTGQLKVTVPTAAVTGPISVTNAGGTTTTANQFTVDPTITKFLPGSAATGAVITVNGSGFAGADRVDFGGGVSSVPTNVTANSLKVAVPHGAATGPIRVHTGAGLSPASVASFTVTFSVTSIAPTLGTYGSDVTVNGVGLTGVTAVNFNGHPGVIQAGGTATQLHVHVPATGSVTGHVTVLKGLAGVQAPQDFKLLDVSSLAPTSGVPGTSITISGSGFTGAADVKFNGTSAVFTVDNDGQITATIPAGATTGTVAVTVASTTATSSGSITVTDVAGVVINEFSLGTTTATTDDFVELYNTGTGAVDVSSCELRYAHATDSVVVIPVSATRAILAPSHYFVVEPTQDLDGTDGGLKLVCGTTQNDAAGWGTAPDGYFEGSAVSAPAVDTSAARVPDGADTADNSTDLAVGATPTPGATNGVP